MSIETAYSKPRPDAWGDLVSYAETVLPSHADHTFPFSLDASANMLQQAAVLETNPLDANVYYGMGLGLRDLYAQLREPGVKGKTIDALQRQFEGQQLNARRLFDGPLDRELARAFVAAGRNTFQPLAYTAMRSLSAANQLTVEALTVTTIERRNGRQVFSAPDTVDDVVAKTVSQGEAAARIIAANSIGGSVFLWRKATEAKREVDPECRPEDVEDQDLTKVAGQAARLHSDEFNSEFINQLLVPDEDGNLIFDRSRLPREPQLPTPDRKFTKIQHTGREKCPAVFVGRLMLIEDVLDIVWQAGQRARA
jgi:hypothetical protein